MIFPPAKIMFPPAKIIFSPAKIIFQPAKIIFPPAKIIFPPAKIIFPPVKIIFPPAKIISHLQKKNSTVPEKNPTKGGQGGFPPARSLFGDRVQRYRSYVDCHQLLCEESARIDFFCPGVIIINSLCCLLCEQSGEVPKLSKYGANLGPNYLVAILNSRVKQNTKLDNENVWCSSFDVWKTKFYVAKTERTNFERRYASPYCMLLHDVVWYYML